MVPLIELAAAAEAAQEPKFTTRGRTNFGGVDPLGLRQINFDLMDEILPGLNNVARHVKPFVVVAWAWRRAHQRAKLLGRTTIPRDKLQDFVDRIEVLYALSQFLRDERTDLPGSQSLAPWLHDTQLRFGGVKWNQQRKKRRYSTALSAPINYGPGLKMLGWVTPHPEYPSVMMPTQTTVPALDAIEMQIASVLDHEAFNKFGSVTVATDDARKWGNLWALDKVTGAEARVVTELLTGSVAPLSRRLGVNLMRAAARHVGTTAVGPVRAAMSGPPSGFVPTSPLFNVQHKWRILQMRQLFRLALEAFFFWTMRKLDGAKRPIDSLVNEFVDQVPCSLRAANTSAWMQLLTSPMDGPTEIVQRIENALEDPEVGDLPHSIAWGLAFSLREETPDLGQQPERLPLRRAQEEAMAFSDSPIGDFVRHVLESWVLEQHVYWSVGRGLADARARGRTLLRLRVILDEGGWMLTPGSPAGLPPRPTPDRLHTALSLARECGLIEG